MGCGKKADLGFIDLVLKPEGNYWAGDIDSSIAKGKLKIPVDLNGPDSISLAMDVLDFTALKQLKSQSEALKPAPVTGCYAFNHDYQSKNAYGSRLILGS